MLQQQNDINQMNRMSAGDSEGNNETRGRDAVATAFLTGGSSNADTRRGDSRPKKNEVVVKSTQRAL